MRPGIKPIGRGCETMEIKEVTSDAAKYPASDWMKVILLGFLSLISLIGVVTELNLFTVLCLILLPLPIGYSFRIIKASFDGFDELPEFNNWKSMYLDGLKVIVTLIIYAIPVIAVFLFFNPDLIFHLDMVNFTLLYLGSSILNSTTQIIIFILIGFIEYIGIANMALYDGEISAAFRFREIIRRISSIGYKKYLLSYIIVWVLAILSALVSYITLLILIGIVIIPLLIAPYFMILTARFLALVFASSES